MAITKKQFRKSYRLILDWDDLPSSLLQLVFACFLTLSLGSCLAAVRHPLFFICWLLSRVSSLASSSPYITYDAWEITFCLSSDLDPCLLRKSKEAHLLLDFLKVVLSFSPFKKYLSIYLAALGLSCGTWDLLSLLRHAGSLLLACGN